MIATEGDLPAIAALGAKAHAASAYAGLVPFDQLSFVRSCRHLMEDLDGLVLFNGTASLWLKRFPLYFNHAVPMTAEIFFAGVNGQPLRRFAEHWAEGGVISFGRNAATDDRLDNIYRRAGYQPIEHTWVRRA